MEKFLILGQKITAVADAKMNSDISKKLWSSFSLNRSQIEFTNGEENTFQIGNTPLPALCENEEYAICIDENGCAISARDFGSLMRGFFALLFKIDCQTDTLKIDKQSEKSDYILKKRMIHICVAPEHDLYYIKKLVRLIALCQYTHIVIEFWGMLKFDCLKELSWPFAFSKEEVKELIREVRDLGMEPIPTLNMFGHATGSRISSGKHVVLDQNPSLQHLFTPDGWAWDITSNEVFSLLTNVRSELYDLFGEGEFFHIGCDEAYYYTQCDELRSHLPDYLNKLTNAVVNEGRRPMLWMDMILERDSLPNNYYAFGIKGESEKIISSLAKESVMVDWQYYATTVPYLSSESLKSTGFDIIVAPWFDSKNYNAAIGTVKELDLFAVMLTTWHTIAKDGVNILGMAHSLGAKTFYWSRFAEIRAEMATLFRRVSFEGNDYESSGWVKNQFDV